MPDGRGNLIHSRQDSACYLLKQGLAVPCHSGPQDLSHLCAAEAAEMDSNVSAQVT